MPIHSAGTSAQPRAAPNVAKRGFWNIYSSGLYAITARFTDRRLVELRSNDSYRLRH